MRWIGNTGWMQRMLRWIKKVACRILYRNSTLERLCLSVPSKMSTVHKDTLVRVRNEIWLSKKIDDGLKLIWVHLDLVDVEFTVQGILDCKRITDSYVRQVLTSCFEEYNRINAFGAKIVSLQKTAYDSKNEEHETLLAELWSLLKPNVRRTGRVTKEWSEIGFQGDDPKTDFRGMGVLSLHQLVYFAKHHAAAAQSALLASNHKVQWFPFSVCGIQITSFILELMHARLLDRILFNCPNLERAFHDYYAYLFESFANLWVESKPKDAMAFPVVFEKLKVDIRGALKREQL